MRARNCFCTLTVSALALTVAAYAAPRDAAAEGKGTSRTESSRLLSGADAQLRDAAGGVATQGNPYYRFAPVVGPQSAGSAVNTAAGTVTIGSPNNNLVYLEFRLDGWGSVEDGTLKTVQAQIDSATYTTGTGAPVDNAVRACVVNADCEAIYGAGPMSSFTFCNALVCENAFQQNSRADFPFPGVSGVSACSLATPDRQCGSTALAPPIPDGAGEAYVGTVVLNVPAGAAGTYTIDMIPLGTFMQSGNNNVPPLAKITPAEIIIPVGSCCFGVGGPGAGCDENLTQAECDTRPAPRLPIRVGVSCAVECAECIVAADCTDQTGACSTYQCVNNTCIRNPIPGYVSGGPNCCNPANGQQAPRADADPCTTDTCTVNDAASLGVPNHSPAADGTGCDDDNPCTAADACTGGACAGHNVNGDPCATDADCQNGGSTPGAVCDGELCSCTLEPDLTFEKVDPPANNCYEEGDKITVAIHVGPAANTINGGQFAIVYDNDCLDFNSISVAPGPYSNVIFQQVNEGAGTIFFAVGVQLGGVGVQGNSDMALLSFDKLGDCDECVLCFTDNNPIHTYLTDDTGQPIGVNESCSKPIRLLPEITLDTPDGNLKVNTGCDSSNATVTWDAPSATSSCGDVTLVCTGEHVESGTILDNTCLGGTRNGLPCTSQQQCPAGQCLPGPNGGGVFPIGNSNFCCTAGDPVCGGTLEQCWTVTVNDETSLDVEIQLSPTMVTKPGGGIVRCIKFEVFSNCIQAPLVFEEDMTFGGLFDLVGHFTGFVKIPSAVQPECITARDQLHTLRSCYTFNGSADCVDGVLNATFKGDPFFGGNWLIGGNLDGWKKDNPASSHDVIDILDFGSIVAEWLATYDSNGDSIPDGNTPCGVFDSTHADINGDGLVDLLDYSFISMNFLEDSKDCCCPGSSSLGNTNGRTEISVRELFESGQGDLAVADLNADGTVNLADMAALMQGVRPAQKPADRGGKDSGTRSFNKR